MPRYDPFKAGYIAAMHGLPRYANPCRPLSRFRENWDAGWLSAVRTPRYAETRPGGPAHRPPERVSE